MVLEASLHDESRNKNVISDDGKKQLTHDVYRENNFTNTICPITQENFSEGDSIILLPCKHCFFPDGINRWLQDKKAECPVCRFKLMSKEVVNEDCNLNENQDSDEDSDSDSDDDDDDDDDDDSEEETYDSNINSLLQNLHNSELNVIGNRLNFNNSPLNPLIRNMIENVVFQNFNTELNAELNAELNTVPNTVPNVALNVALNATPNVQPNLTENTFESSDNLNEDLIDLQYALYASINNN